MYDTFSPIISTSDECGNQRGWGGANGGWNGLFQTVASVYTDFSLVLDYSLMSYSPIFFRKLLVVLINRSCRKSLPDSSLLWWVILYIARIQISIHVLLPPNSLHVRAYNLTAWDSITRPEGRWCRLAMYLSPSHSILDCSFPSIVFLYMDLTCPFDE